MAVTLSQVANTQSFGVWLERTNQILLAMSANVVTTDLSTIGALTTGNAYVNGVFGSVTMAANTIHGGNNTNRQTLIVTSNAIVNSTILVGNSSANVLVGLDPTTNSLTYESANFDSFAQHVIYNANGGGNATTDLIINADNATDTSNYIDIGINSSGYTNGAYSINGALGGYIYTSNSSLAIGTASAYSLQFFANGTGASNEVMRIDGGANVGIGNTNPAAKLHVQGTGIYAANLQVGGVLRVTNTAFFANTTVAGFANVTTTGQFGSNVDIGGYANVTGTLYAGGAANLQSTVGVLRATTLANTLAVTGNVTISNTMDVVGAVLMSNTLAVTGNVTISNAVTVNAPTVNVNITSNNLNVTAGNTIFNGNVTITGSDTILNNLRVANAVVLGANLSVNGVVTMANSITVSSFANVAGNLRVGGDLVVDGNLAFNIKTSGDFVPTQNNFYQIGNTTYRWVVWGTDGHFSNNIIVGAESDSSIGANLIYIDVTNRRIGIGNTTPGNRLTSNGIIETTSGGFKFPDTTTQTTAAFPNGANGQIQFFDTTKSSQFNGNTALTFTPANATLSLTGNLVVSSTASLSHAAITSGTYSVSGTAAQTMDSYSATSYRAAEYLVQLTDSSNYNSVKLLVVHDGSTAYVTQFGDIITGSSLGTFAADINGGNVRIRLTPTAGTVVAKFARTTIVV